MPGDMVHPDLWDILESERTHRFQGLLGSSLDIVLPVRQAALDAALAQVPEWPTPLEGLTVRIAADNLIHVGARVRIIGFSTTVRLQLRLDPTIDRGIMRLSIDDGSLAGRAASLIGPLLKQLPRGVTLDGKRVVVDTREFAAQQGVEDLASMLSSATLRSDEGVLWVEARVEVHEGIATASARAERPGSGARRLPFSVPDLLGWLRGTRVDADIRFVERLVNEVLVTAFADIVSRASSASGSLADPAPQAGADEVIGIVTRALTPPRVTFEDGAMRVTTTFAPDPPLPPSAPGADREHTTDDD